MRTGCSCGRGKLAVPSCCVLGWPARTHNVRKHFEGKLRFDTRPFDELGRSAHATQEDYSLTQAD
jgi:hypothetical protein